MGNKGKSWRKLKYFAVTNQDGSVVIVRVGDKEKIYKDDLTFIQNYQSFEEYTPMLNSNDNIPIIMQNPEQEILNTVPQYNLDNTIFMGIDIMNNEEFIDSP